MSKAVIKELGKEYPEPNEAELISQLKEIITAQMEHLYGPGKTLRQAHPKDHGYLKVEFRVEKDLPEMLRKGIFASPNVYEGTLRVSNASSEEGADADKDVRGFALKLFGVRGEKLIQDQPRKDTQDFLLISSSTFFAKNLKEFTELLYSLIKGTGSMIKFALNPFDMGTFYRAVKELVKVSNVLQIPYYSAVPYRYGGKHVAVKYKVSPVSPDMDPIPPNPSPDFLRKSLVEYLKVQDVEYDFFVQFQDDAETMPIEDPTVEWDSPFHKVARIRIPQQDFVNQHSEGFHRPLSFNPWHSLEAHRPLGAFNRARKQVYPASVKHRHAQNRIDFRTLDPHSSPLAKRFQQFAPTNPSTSMKNKEIVSSMLEAYQKQDLATVLSLMSDDVKWITPGNPKEIPFAGTHVGKEAITNYFGMQANLIQAVEFTPTGLIGGEDENQQVFMAHEKVLVKPTGKYYDITFALAISLKDGKVVQVETLMDTSAVAAAFQA